MEIKRKKRVDLVYTLFFILLFYSGYSQIVKDFCSYSQKKDILIGNEYKYVDIKYKIHQRIVFLGVLLSKENKAYNVYTLIMNLDGKGVNKLIFICDGCKIYEYSMDLPSDLPFKIVSNKLYFKNESTIKSMAIDKLNDIFCTPFECF